MSILRQILTLSLVLASWSLSASAEASVFDQYVGVLRHSQTNRDQFAKLDFVADREADGQLHLSAVLTLYFGDFDSQEYLSYHFKSVRYNLVTGRLVFDEPDQDITVRSTAFGGGRLTADVRSTLNGMVGTLELAQDGSVTPSRPIIKPLWGEYQGTCDEADTYLQINTFRRSDGAFDDGTSPFRSYEINGQYGRVDSQLCPNPTGRPCVTNQIHAGTYNFFRETLQLAGRQRNLTCEVGETGIKCGTCDLRRISRELAGPLRTVPRQATNTLLSGPAAPGSSPAASGPAATLEGEYYGYLHHEFLDAYQPAQLNIIAFQDPDGDGTTLKLSASARLFFGDFGANEALTYRFDAREFNIINPQLVFKRPDVDLDASLQVSSLGGGRVRGVWFSRIFGRVGTFELIQGTPPVLGPGLKKLGALSGEYESSVLELKVQAQLGAGAAASENPFNPLELTGHLWYKDGIAPRISISEGTYDFYTGRMSLRTVDDYRVAVGEADLTESRLKVKLPPKVFGALMAAHEPAEYAPIAELVDRENFIDRDDFEAIYRYELQNLPETEATCPDAARDWAAELARVTGVTIVAQGCERPIGDDRRGMNVIISYTASRALPAGTTAQDFLYGGSPTAADCDASLAQEIRTFTSETGLDVFAAYCSPTGYLTIRSFGVSPVQRRVFQEGFSGAGLDDIYIEDPAALLDQFVQAVEGLGVTVAKSVVRRNHAYIYYYARQNLWFEVLAETGYLDEGDCNAQKTAVAGHLRAFSQRPLVQYCAPTTAYPTPRRELFTFVWVHENVGYGQVRTLYQERLPGDYPTLADCETARPRVEAQYQSQGYTVYNTWCTLPERGAAYSIDIFRQR